MRQEVFEIVQKMDKDNIRTQMKAAAAELNFEMAAELRDKMITLKKSLDDMEE